MIDLIGLFKSVQGKKARTNSHILKAGFTLIKLSIVLVIIGLLLGGIIVGQDLIHAAQIRSVIADIDKYKTAYNTFKGKYNCIPGDCINATDFFGAENSDFNTCAALTTPSTGSLTCNGDGNGKISDFGTVATYYEMFRFWQQLAISGLINGQYTGVTGAGGVQNHITGVNAPGTDISNSGFAFRYFSNFASTATYNQNYGNSFIFGATTTLDMPQAGLFTTSEAQAFDKKIDDGKPATGIVIMRSVSNVSVGNGNAIAWNSATACTTSTSNTDFTGVYNIATSAISCSFVIKTGNY